MTRYIAAAILAAAVCVVAISAPGQAQNQRFQIASGDLGPALDAYIHQSGRQLIYRVDDVRGVHSPGVIVRSDGADIHSGPLFMRVTAFADDILRVRAAAAEALPEDASWAVSEETRG